MFFIAHFAIDYFIEILCSVAREVLGSCGWHKLLLAIFHFHFCFMGDANNVEWSLLHIGQEGIHQLAKITPIIIVQLVIFRLILSDVSNCAIGKLRKGVDYYDSCEGQFIQSNPREWLAITLT